MIDLHVHSNHSDGTLPPEELVILAVQTGLTAFALTDHDTVSGIQAAKEAAASSGSGLTVISGTEISAAYKKKDIHILGLFIDETNPVLLDALNDAVNARDARNEQMAERFRTLGIPVTLDELRLDNPDTVITRAHFANYLIKHGHVKTSEEAFRRYLGYDGPCFVPREYMQPERAISLILEAGVPSSIYMTVTPVSVSPAIMALCIGAAPRYLGSRDTWRLMQPYWGKSST